MAPLAFSENEELPLLPSVQWSFFLGLGIFFFWLFGRWIASSAETPVKHLRELGAIAATILFPLRAFWVEATLPARADPRFCGIEESTSLAVRHPRALATPYVYLFAAIYAAAVIGYFAIRSARKSAQPRAPSATGAGLTLLGFAALVLLAIQLGPGLLTTLVAPVAWGVTWSPVVVAVLLGRELVLAVASAMSRDVGARFAARTVATAVVVGTLCVAGPALATHDIAALWRLFSQTSAWTFSQIPASFACPDP
jgi:hypothetical protein